MGLQDKLSAAKASLLRQYEQMSGEHLDEEGVCVLSGQILSSMHEGEIHEGGLCRIR